jgi:type III restriction enzyme
MFNGRVSIHDKESVLSGAWFHASSVLEETSVIVLSMQSFRSKNKEWRKAYEENGNLQSFSGKYESWVSIEWAEELSLIKVLHNLNPIVVVDESHRAESDLSREMLINLNPRFILGLTATPQKDANIISFVDAIALKKEQMVKLRRCL